MDNQLSEEKLEAILAELEEMKEENPEEYANRIQEVNAALENYNQQISALIARLDK